MAKIKIIWIIGIFILIPEFCLAQFSREQAKNFVFNQLLADELDYINVYIATGSKSGQDGLTLGNLTSISYPFVSNWVFFIDDYPYAGWVHPCRYIFIDTETGDFFTANKTFFPEGLNTDFELISAMPSVNPGQLPLISNNVPIPVEKNPHLYAVIICGSTDLIFWNDVSAVYTTLTIYYGFKKENIFVHFYNGPYPAGDIRNDLDGDDEFADIDYDAHKVTIENTFQALTNGNTALGIPSLTQEDALFVFVSDHGDKSNGHSRICLLGSETLSDNELANDVKNINCSQMIFLLAQCYSGGFIDDIMNFSGSPLCENRYVYTAAADTELSHHELWVTSQKLVNGCFFEFVYYWTAAMRGSYPHTEYPYLNSYNVGQFPFHEMTSFMPPSPPAKLHTPDWNPDNDLVKGGNNDLVFQMREAFNYADSMDSWSPNGFYCLCPRVANYEYNNENPQTSESINNSNGNGGFRDNVVGLSGLIGHMRTSQNVDGNRNYLIGGQVTVDNNCALDIGQHATLYLKNDLTVNGSINFADNLTIFGLNEPGTDLYGLDVTGAIQLGSYSNFNKCSFSVSYPATTLSLNHATFNNSYFSPGALSALNVNWSNFNDCGGIMSNIGNVVYDNSSFVNTALSIYNYGPTNSNVAIVQNCNFIGSNSSPFNALDIGFYKYYHLFGNTINNYYNGISLTYCGKQNGEQNQNLANNYISNCISSGVQLYNSSGKFINNHIFDNGIGVRLMNSSFFAVNGTSNAPNSFLTQNIKNNSSFQLYADRYSFPYLFQYNIVQGTGQERWIFWDCEVGPQVNVGSNCWGSYFNPSNDLYPVSNYVGYGFVWCPGGGPPIPVDPPVDALFNNGEEAFFSEDYYNAKEIFQSIVFNHPCTKEAEESLKELFRLEYYTGNNYLSLKEYYLSNDSVITYPSLKVLGEFLANRCDVAIENWDVAINWYENKIQNPDNTQDSVYSIIDLGYVYLLMDSANLKSKWIGTFPQYKPKNLKSFIPYRDSLLLLVPGKLRSDQMKRNVISLKNGELLQNVPNPVKNETEIFLNWERNAVFQSSSQIT